MFIGHFTEQPWQDPKTGIMGTQTGTAVFFKEDLGISNSLYDPPLGAELYNRYLDEKVYADEIGFDGLMLNEHHSTPFCMQGVTNTVAYILARITKRAKITILGNLLPLWDDPLWLAEQISMLDMISGGRVISGWVRGTGRESIAHNANPNMNWDRYQEAHDFVVKTWTTPGPFRWEGKYYHYRYVNPWAMPLQRPHPPIWIPGAASRATVKWSAENHFPYVMIAGDLGLARLSFDYYKQVAAENGYESGTHHVADMVKLHVDDTEELAEATARKFLSGVSNPFLTGNEGVVKPWLMNLPGLNPRTKDSRMPVAQSLAAGRGGIGRLGFEEQVKQYQIIYGTPKTVIPKVRHVLEYLRPGSIFFWDGDGGMTHDDQMRSLRLFGQEVIPATRAMGKELALVSPFEVDDGVGYDQAAWKKARGKA
jgi:alkanesulfonate monooxygenase SsuD/methylene tetrahydromethanopterin reductase-like flavin-dependent oxidoreductase (luciferase family)